ncbi:argininosuccinate synthase domain-containing protein [Nitratifractor sp.]
MRAIALFSGGLDSMLAVKLMTEQGIDVTALHVHIGFGSRGDVSEQLRRRAELAGAKFRMVDTREEYIREILFDPVYGYGKNFNPCIDCHGYMFKIARALMEEEGASFLVTGEVVGQRPMSQRPDALKLVQKLAGDRDEHLILRPLSAKLMEPTKPEIEGWVDRERLLDINGRGRERQLAMAAAYGWEDYESPGGGCLLTDRAFSQKLRDFVAHEEFGVEDIDLLKYGRHFRLPGGAKLVVGRHKEDNEALQKIENPDYLPVRLPIAGPYSLLWRGASPADRELAARIALTYAKSDPTQHYSVQVGEEEIEVSPFASKAEAQRYFVLKP